MAKKEDRKKQKKREKEDKRAARRRDFQAAQAKANRYPRIRIDPAGGDPRFVQVLTDLVNQFSYEDDSCCPEELRENCKLLKQHGLDGLRLMAKKADAFGYADPSGMTPEWAYQSLLRSLLIGLGDWLFRQLPKQYTEHPLPYFYFHVEPLGDEFHINCSFLPSVRVPELRSPIFYSPLTPTIEMGGGKWRLGFVDHVLERACERMSSTQPITYRAFQGCQIYFENCIYYEPVMLPSGQNAVRLWHSAYLSQHADYVADLLGQVPQGRPGDNWCVIIGYCPLEVIRMNAVGITLLFPGYRNTPEAHLVNTTPLPRNLRDRLQAAAKDNTLARVLNKESLEVMRWYHHNGAEQVRNIACPLFDASPRMREWDQRKSW
jgi:hypothetical protein